MVVLEVQLPTGRASRLHCTATGVDASVAEKTKVAPVLVVGLVGCAVMLSTGPVRSIRHVWVAGDGSTVPTPLRTRTWKVWLASVRFE